jgi:predicted  nucleic acid-binding Zn-ribbon protein
MITTDGERTAQVVDHTRRLEEYKETLSRLFPSLPRETVDARSIRDVDALVLALFLRCYPHEVNVLEVGTYFGVSTFHIASQPSVVRVLGVNPDLQESKEAAETPDYPDTKAGPESLQGPSKIDVARAALAEFAEQGAKIKLRTGSVGSAWAQDRGHSPDGSEEIPAQDEPLLAFVGGASTREAVEADLQAIFDARPRAVAIIDHCRGAEGLFVQAGIADFLAGAQGEYHFGLFADLTTGLATSNLGIVYPDSDAAEVQECLEELSHLFSERLDPLWLAAREQELIGIVNKYKDEANVLSGQLQDLSGEYQILTNRNKELENRISQLEKRKSHLEERTAGLKLEKKELQKRSALLEKRTTQLEKRKTQLEEINAGLKQEKEGLQGRASNLEKGNSRLEERNSRLEARNSRLKEERSLLDSQLTDFRSAGRYRLADAVTKSVLRIPGAKAVARRTRPEK